MNHIQSLLNKLKNCMGADTNHNSLEPKYFSKIQCNSLCYYVFLQLLIWDAENIL